MASPCDYWGKFVAAPKNEGRGVFFGGVGGGGGETRGKKIKPSVSNRVPKGQWGQRAGVRCLLVCV